MRAIVLKLCTFLALVTVWGGVASAAEVLSLAEFKSKVLARSPELAFSRAEVGRSRALLRSARKDRYPSLSAEYDYTRQDDSISAFGFPSSKDVYSYSISLDQPVYRGGALRTAVQASRLGVDLSQAQLHQSANDLLQLTYQRYFNLLLAMKLTDEAQQAVLRLESHLKDAKSFFETGLIPKNDLLESEVELAQGRQDLVRAENGVRLARAAMNIMLERPVDTPFEVENILSHAKREVEWEAALATALELRPEIAQSRYRIDLAAENITLAGAPYLPQVNLAAVYLKQGDDPLARTHPYLPSEQKSVQAMASWRFWAWGQKGDEVAAARLEQEKARQALVEARDAVTLQLRQAYLDFQEAEKNIGVTEKAVEQAEENFRISQARFQAQLSTSTDVLDAQVLLTRARTNYYRALYDYNLALISLDWATGKLLAQLPEP